MPSKQELEKLINDCIKKKGWSYDRCKRYIAGGIWGNEEMTQEDKEVYNIEAVPILKTGNWRDMNGVNVSFTIKDLDEIARNTNALLKSNILEPPLKLGHNESQNLIDGLPAIGYVSQVYRLGNQLFADFVNVPKKIYDLIQKKAYSKVSAEVYTDFIHPETNEKIGKTLRAVALLGADLPAIKGLGDILSLYKAKEYNQQSSLLCFSENELESKKQMEVNMKKWKLEDIKDVIKCDACVEMIKKFMKEDKKDEISTEDLAVYLTKMRMMKLEDSMKNEKKDNEIICPDGYEWNGVECISKNKEVVDEGHICPQGYKWDETQNKCVPIEIEDKKDIDFKDKEKIKKIADENKDKIKSFKFKNDERPPKGWWDECISAVSDITDTPEKLCGWIYYDWMGPERKKEIEATRQKEQETQKMSENKNDEVIKLQEKVKELTRNEFKNKLEELKKNNRDILIPALDEQIDNLLNYFIEKEDVIKLSDNKEISTIDYFFKFLNSFINAKRVIFSELAKSNEAEINNILNSDDTVYDGKIKVENVKLAKLAEHIEKKENITYKEALMKAKKIIEKGGK